MSMSEKELIRQALILLNEASLHDSLDDYVGFRVVAAISLLTLLEKRFDTDPDAAKP